jgi:hypothetical protein
VDVLEEIKGDLEDAWLPTIYRDKVRPQRTRAYRLDVPKRENAAEIQYTLLGIELRIGRRRFSCPDLSTARYLRVFARLGCSQFAIPYDITQIPAIADELETSWQRILLLLAQLDTGRDRTRVVKAVRDEILKIGPGDAMPAFDRETRQRRPDSET